MDVLIAGNMKSIPPNTPDSQIFVVQKTEKNIAPLPRNPL